MRGIKGVPLDRMCLRVCITEGRKAKRTPWILAWVTGWLVVTFVKIVNTRKSEFGRER